MLNTLCSAAMSQRRRDPCNGRRWQDLPWQFTAPGQDLERAQVASRHSDGCTPPRKMLSQSWKVCKSFSRASDRRSLTGKDPTKN